MEATNILLELILNFLPIKFTKLFKANSPALPVNVFAFPELTKSAFILPFFKFFIFQSIVIDLVLELVKTSAIFSSESNINNRTSSLL